jgi:hypothetical protein
MSWRRAHLGTCDQILILSEFRCYLCSLTRGRVCLSSVTVSNNCSLSIFFFCFCLFVFPPFSRHILCIYNTRKAWSAQAQYSKSCCIICSLYYKPAASPYISSAQTAQKTPLPSSSCIVLTFPSDDSCTVAYLRRHCLRMAGVRCLFRGR